MTQYFMSLKCVLVVGMSLCMCVYCLFSDVGKGGGLVMQSHTPNIKICHGQIYYPHTALSFVVETSRPQQEIDRLELEDLNTQKKDNHLQEIAMWVLEKIKEGMESIPLELSRYMGKSEEDGFLSSRASLSCNLPNNILTPDKIPEFCLPPRLCRRSPQPETDAIAANLHRQHQILQSPKSRPPSVSLNAKVKEVKMKNGDALVARKAQRKPLPFSAELYGLTGIYESPNTRRKESLFHSKRPVYTFDRSTATSAPRQVKETNRPKKSPTGFLPSFLCKSLLEIGGTDSETPSSSSDSSPFRSPHSISSPPYMPQGSGRIKGATSCPSLNDSRVEKEKWKSRASCLTTSPSCPPSLEGSSNTLAPPVYFPVEVLQCQEKHQREHVLPLQGRGKVRVFAEYTTFSTTLRSLFTVRVRLVSVEDLWDDAHRQTLNCAVNLCLIPGKLQQQNSATIRNCRSPVFNEDFFFTELSRENLLELQLRLRVVNKPAAATLRKGTVIGVISKPLSELINLNKR